MRSKLRLVFALFFSCIISLSSYSLDNTSICEHQLCVAVIDAGSTGSRLHLYTYKLSSSNHPKHIREISNQKITPGLTSIELKPESIDSYLSTLFSDLKTSTIPVYFYSTGGMRLLSQHKQKQYYKHIKNWFSHHSNFKLLDIKTISGTEEAIFDWVSVNYILGNFDTNTEDYAAVMDMGGASVQVVFPLVNPSVHHHEKVIKLEINDKPIHLFAHSFLGLGQTEVSHQFLNDTPCFSKGYPLADGGVGDGEAMSCVDDITHLLNHVQHVDDLIQADLKNQPPLTWYALGGIGYLTQTPYFEIKHHTFTPSELLQAANQNLCHAKWQELEEHSNDEYVYAYCLNASYYYALMVNGYGLTDYTPIHTLPKENAMDWSLGVVLLKNQI